jgi:hypothetical protein
MVDNKKNKLGEALAVTPVEAPVQNPEQTAVEDEQIAQTVADDVKNSLPVEAVDEEDTVMAEDDAEVVTEDSFVEEEGGVDAIPLTTDVINKLVLGEMALKLVDNALRKDRNLIQAVIQKKEDAMIQDIHRAEKMKKKIVINGQVIMKEYDNFNEEYKNVGDRLFKKISA